MNKLVMQSLSDELIKIAFSMNPFTLVGRRVASGVGRVGKIGKTLGVAAGIGGTVAAGGVVAGGLKMGSGVPNAVRETPSAQGPTYGGII